MLSKIFSPTCQARQCKRSLSCPPACSPLVRGRVPLAPTRAGHETRRDQQQQQHPPPSLTYSRFPAEMLSSVSRALHPQHQHYYDSRWHSCAGFTPPCFRSMSSSPLQSPTPPFTHSKDRRPPTAENSLFPALSLSIPPCPPSEIDRLLALFCCHPRTHAQCPGLVTCDACRTNSDDNRIPASQQEGSGSRGETSRC